MSDDSDWREVARIRFREAVGPLLDAAPQWTEAERAAHLADMERDTRARARANGLEEWAPWEACLIYLNRVARTTDAMRADLRFSLHRVEMEKFRLLLTHPAMRDVWAQMQAQGVDLGSFAMWAAEYARRCTNGVSDWAAQSKTERAEASLEIATLARKLARKLERSPARGESVFQFFDDVSASHIALHALHHPYEVIACIPGSAQDAVRHALPPAPSVASYLEQIARRADEWARQSPPFGRKDKQQPARAFVRKLADYLHKTYGNPMLKEVGVCCYVLLGVDFEMAQLRNAAKTSPEH